MPDFICPPFAAPRIPAGAEIHPGVGRVGLCRDGVEVESDCHGEHNIDHYTQKIHRARRPAHASTPVWTLHIDGPLSSQVYAYTTDGEWTLIDTKDGFA